MTASPSSCAVGAPAGPRVRSLLSALAPALACLALWGQAAWHLPAHAATSTQASANASASHNWAQLGVAQRKALAPLASQWATMPEANRVKWLEVARRFDQLGPAEQARLQERMASWAALPADQRGEARLRYQQSRQLPPDRRQQRWEAYQALSSEEKQDLGRQAQRRNKPVMLPDRVPGPREPAQAFANRRKASPTGSPAKSNVVPNTVTATVRQPTVVSPATVKAGSGATTNLVTRQPSPPMHQQVGLPKVNAAKGSVDPVTLLPRTGAQGAAMASLPAPGQRP